MAWQKHIYKIEPQVIAGDEEFLYIDLLYAHDLTTVTYKAALLYIYSDTEVSEYDFTGFVESQENELKAKISFQVGDYIVKDQYKLALFDGYNVNSSNNIIVTKDGYYISVI